MTVLLMRSAIALSFGLPLSVMLGVMSCSLRCFMYSALAYWVPRSEWWMRVSAKPSGYVDTAFFKATMLYSASSVGATQLPRTRLLLASMTSVRKQKR